MSDPVPDLTSPGTKAPIRALTAACVAPFLAIPNPIRDVPDPDNCPLPLLPWLSWEESVDEWEADWPEATQRAVIAASRAVHEKKGTAGVLKAAVEALDLGVTLTEWFEKVPPGMPFSVEALFELDQAGLPDGDAIRRLLATAIPVKNLRTLLRVVLRAVSDLGTYVAVAAHYGITVSIEAEPA